jgi:nucleoid-associated protein YgaU
MLRIRSTSSGRAGSIAPPRNPPFTKRQECIMGLIDFVKNAGEKLFGHGQAQAAAKEAAADPADAAKLQAANSAAGDAILNFVKSQNLSATGLTVTYDGATSTVSVFGVAPDQATREKIVLCCGNVEGVAAVKDMMSVDQSAPEAKYYTVVSGDTLSKISKQFYGDANKYNQIFEANKPMLKSPDKIYPGQNLRIPPA